MTDDNSTDALEAVRKEHATLCREFYLDYVVDYAESPGFERRLADEVDACLGPVGAALGVGNSGDPQQDAFWLALDSVLFQGGDGPMAVAARLLKFDKSLTGAHRRLLEAWVGDVPHGFFEVVAHSHDSVALRSLDDGGAYASVYSLLQEWDERALVRGDLVWARLLPCGDGWFPSVPLHPFPTDLRSEIRQVVSTKRRRT